MASILIVDDTFITRDAMTKVFKMFGHEVTAATGLPEAERLLQANKYDGLVTDVHYPGRKNTESGGRELLTFVQAMPEVERPKVLIVSVDEYAVRDVAHDFSSLRPAFSTKGHCIKHIDFANQ